MMVLSHLPYETEACIAPKQAFTFIKQKFASITKTQRKIDRGPFLQYHIPLMVRYEAPQELEEKEPQKM
jgi:hypothetical protein